MFDAICDGNVAREPEPDPDPVVFACSFSNGVLSWNDQGAPRYFVRRVNGGVDTYLGETTGLSLAVSGADEAYIVRHWIAGTPTDAICQP